MKIATLFSGELILSITALVVMTVAMGGLFGLVPGGFVPEEDQGYFLVNVQYCRMQPRWSAQTG